MKPSEICVIIPTINESTLEQVVQEVTRQMPNAEILLAGFGEALHTAQKYNISFLDLKKKTLKPTALNLAVQHSDKNYFIVLDADAIPAKGWAVGMQNAFNDGYSLFSGSIDLFKGSFWMQVYNFSSLHESSNNHKLEPRKYLAAFSLGFTRAVYLANGPFDESLTRSEDFEWTLRATKNKITNIFVPNATVYHYPITKNSFKDNLKYWANSAPDNWKIRLKYADLLNTPFFMQSPLFIFIFLPFLALIPTFRVYTSVPLLMAIKKIYLLPIIYFTKLAWGWGLIRHTTIEKKLN